jgi:hypothetical protein
MLHPKDVTVKPGADAKFVIKDLYAENYQWQVFTPAGYLDITDDGYYSGSHSDTLWITKAPIGFSKNKYRCIISNSLNSYSTNEAELTVEEKEAPKIISSHPDQVLLADNDCQAVLPDFTRDVTATDNYTVNPVISQVPAAGSFIEGSHNTVTLMAADESGNSTTVTFNAEVTDNIKPDIECVKNVNLIIPDGETKYQVPGAELDLVSFSDNCRISTLINDFNQTSTLQLAEFPAGDTTITWTVTDAAGNQRHCYQEISVSQYVGVETLVNAGVKIYPNPTTGKITIESPDYRIKDIKISDVTGNICMEKNTFLRSESIDISHLDWGIYHIIITSGNDIFMYKILLAS